MALTQDTNRQELAENGKRLSDPVAAAATIYQGALVVLNATGYAEAASTATGLLARGVAEGQADNAAGADGDINVTLRTGVFYLKNSAAADEITRAEIGADCYIVDDETVAKTDGTGTRSVAGNVNQVDANGVWVAVGL